MTNNQAGQGKLQQGSSTKSPLPQGKSQPGQSPFQDIEDRRRIEFELRCLDSNLKTGLNTSYEVLLDEKADGSIETIHLNRKFYSQGYEIGPTTITAICGSCSDIVPSKVIKQSRCGRQLCPRCRVRIFGKYFCKWKCFCLGIIGFTIKGLIKIILYILGFVLKLVLRLIAIPFRDIHRG